MNAVNPSNHFEADSLPPKSNQAGEATRKTSQAKKGGPANLAGLDQAKAPDPVVAKPREPFVITHQDVLDVALNIANADPSDLVAVEISPCRYCHGEDHSYQWRTMREFSEAHDDWACLPYKEQRTKREPTAEGGFGYTRKMEPDECCPECDGWGIPEVHYKASQDANGKSHPLYNGLKIMPHGFEFKMLNRMSYWNIIARMMGFFNRPRAAEPQEDGLSLLLREIWKKGSMAPIKGFNADGTPVKRPAD